MLSTPQIAGQSRVGQIWLIRLGIADSLLVLFVLAAAAAGDDPRDAAHPLRVEGRAAPDRVRGDHGQREPFALRADDRARERALGAGSSPAASTLPGAATQLKDFVVGALSGAGIFVILLGLARAVLAVMLLILYIVRAAIVLILIARRRCCCSPTCCRRPTGSRGCGGAA